MPTDARLHPTHDPELIAAYAAGDATGSDLVAAEGLVAGCAECATLHRDLRAIMTALPNMPAPARTRDFRLTRAQAVAIRPSRLARLLAPLAGARFAFAAPAGAGLAALGLAGILLSGGLNVQPPSAATANRPAVAPEGSGEVLTGVQGNAAAPSAAPSVELGVVDQAAPSAAASMAAGVKRPSGVAPSAPPPSPGDAQRPAASADVPTAGNGARFGPARVAGSDPGASVPPQVPAPTHESAVSSAAAPSTTSPLLILGIGLVVVGALFAVLRWATRRLA